MQAEWQDAASATQASTWTWVQVQGQYYAVRRGQTGSIDCLPRRPRLALDAAGRPRIGLLVILYRAPLASDNNVAPLIAQGRLTLVVTLDLPAYELEALQRELGAPCRPAFLHRVAFALGAPQGVLTEAEGAGGAALVPLSVVLPPSLTLEALTTLDGLPSDLRLATNVGGIEPPGLDPVRLDELVRDCGGTLDREAAIRLMVLDTSGATTPAPRRLRGLPPAGPTRSPGGPIAAVAAGDRVTSLLLALAPGSPNSAAALVASAAAQPGGRLSAHQAWYVGTDLAMSISGAPLSKPMPVVEDPAAPIWLDAVNSANRWYAPRFEAVQPAPNADPASAAFSFTVRRMTPAIGPGGMSPGLAATLCFTLRLSAAPEAVQAAHGAPLRQVPLGGLGVALELPYRRPGGAQVLRQRFPGSVTQDGSLLHAAVELLDDWVRIAYAALAYPPAAGMSPPALMVTYAFTAAVPINDNALQVVAGGKRLAVAVLAHLPPQPDPQPVYIASQHALVTPQATLVLAQEAVVRGPPLNAAALHLQPAATPLPRLPIVLSRPPVIQPFPPVPPHRRGTRTIAREDRVEASFPCAALGGLYLQEADGHLTPIGCQDALKLGTASGNAFQELPALRDPTFRVYRSLQQPGRFLLLPTTWRVGRHGPNVPERAYRPMMLLYAQLADTPEKDRYTLAATLVADVGAAALVRLRGALLPQAPAKAPLDIVLPTDPFVGARTTFTWAVPAGMAAPETLVVADSFAVTMDMDGPTALLVTTAIGRAGISGQVSFALPDGSNLSGALQLDGEIVGPAEGGPVTASRSGADMTLVNHTAQPMNVFGVVSTDAGGAVHEAAVTATLAAGESRTVPVALPPGSSLVDARAAGIADIQMLDLFVEDISQAVLFVNQLNFANHGITALAVVARIQGAGPEQQRPLPEGGTLSLNFSLPVTAYLERRKLEFALAITKSNGTTPLVWRERELSSSTVVGITPDLL